MLEVFTGMMLGKEMEGGREEERGSSVLKLEYGIKIYE